MIYGYLAYLHIRGRGGAIRSETQGQRQYFMRLFCYTLASDEL